MVPRDTQIDLHELIQRMQTTVIVVDSTLCIHFINESGLALLETGFRQVQGRPLNDFVSEDRFSLARYRSAFDTSEGFNECESQLFLKDGRIMMVDIQVSLHYQQKSQYLLIEILPIDKQRKLTLETQQYAQQTAAKELIRGLAHEIKNPLGGIRGAAQLLSKELKDPAHNEFTEMIIDQADRLRSLVDRLLGPNSLPQKKVCNIHEIIEKVCAVIDADLSHDIHIERDYDPSIPDIYADPDMMQQALLNIAKNASQALKMSKKVNPVMGFRSRIDRQCVIKGKRHGLCCMVSIVDNGPGIPDELRDTLFYPMVTTKLDGSGLGLSIAQTLADHHDGKIDVESYPGYTEFTLHIPIITKDNLNE